MTNDILTIILGIISGAAATVAITFLKEGLEHRRKYKVRMLDKEYIIDPKRPEQTAEKIIAEIEAKRHSPRVMLIYSGGDSDFAKELANDLEQQGINVWYDKNQLKPGDSLREMISSGIMSSQWALVVISSEMPKSTWLKIELNTALHSERIRKRPFIIPVVRDSKYIPEELRGRIYADFTEDYSKGIKSLLTSVINRN